MKKMLRSNKGFSMVELLVALLIMAVIIAAALTMMGGVLNTGKVKADQDSADTIARAIQNYSNATNDGDLSLIGVVSGTTKSSELTDLLTCQYDIDIDAKTVAKATYDKSSNKMNTFGAAGSVTVTEGETGGKIGPFLDGAKGQKPQQNGMVGWTIVINKEIQKATVKPATSDALVTIVP